MFLDIEIEMGGALTIQYIKDAQAPITSIALIDSTTKTKICFIIDKSREIEEINDSPEGEYNDRAIQDKIDDTVEYYMRNKDEFFGNMGYSMKDYLDKDSLVKYLVRNEDYGQMSSYD